MANQRKKGKIKAAFNLLGREVEMFDEIAKGYRDRTAAFRGLLHSGLTDEDVRTKGRRRVNFWLEESERDLIRQLAERYGVNMTEVLRTLIIINQPGARMDPAENTKGKTEK